MGSKKQSYTQMTLAVREEISLGLVKGLKQGAIARQLGYSSCSIGREITRYSECLDWKSLMETPFGVRRRKNSKVCKSCGSSRSHFCI